MCNCRRCRQTFSKVLSLVALYSEYTRTLTFENASATTCSCDDFEVDLALGEAMEDMRCCDAECGSGLGVPVDVGADARRCVHCNAEWH